MEVTITVPDDVKRADERRDFLIEKINNKLADVPVTGTRRFKVVISPNNCCTCKGHDHQGGHGGCYFGGSLVPRCTCTWVDEP